jgi:hypothetical protein
MMRKRLISCSILALTGFIVLAGISTASGWLGEWDYRRPVTVINQCVDPQTDYQVMLKVGSEFDFSEARGDGGDIRFTLPDGTTLLPYWIEDWDVGDETGCVWINMPALGGDDTLVYMYYGNPAEVTTADPDETFLLYDGFEEYALGGPPSGGTTNPGEWDRYAGNPVLVEGSSGSWDDHGSTFSSVIYDSLAGEFRMYYHGFSGGTHQIGLATSPDGLNWTKYPGNPIMTPGPAAWDNSSVRVPMVWKEGLTDYRMIYTGNGSGGMRVGYATSTDGITWTKHPSNPVFNDPTWASGETENWGVIKVGSEYLMWYSDFGMRQSGIAVSTDLVSWTPHTTGPIFASSGDPSDLRYSQFCPFSFKYGDDYYVLVPSYSSVANYSSFYLYRSPSPYFPESNRELVRIAHTVGPSGEWDSHDSDTPCMFTLDIERTQFYNDEIWCYYAAEGGTDHWKVGLMIEPDIAAALSDADLPGEDFTWTTSGDVTVVDSPVRHGVRSVRLNDTSASTSVQLNANISSTQSGRIGAWMRRNSSSNGDCDIYLYGGATLSCVAGLGRDGDFHYWNGSFQSTGVYWALDTWYLVTMAFDTDSDRYDFVVYDESLDEIVRAENIAFGNASSFIDRAMFYTSSGFTGHFYVDDFRLMDWCGAESDVTLGEEEDPTVATVLQMSTVSFEGTYIELKWILDAIDDEARFVVYRAQLPSGEYELLEDIPIFKEDFGFTARDTGIESGAIYRYRVEVLVGAESTVLFETEEVPTPILPLVLNQNHPNPFNPATTIEYYLPVTGSVTLDVYDAAGRRIVRLVDAIQESGNHSVDWNGYDSDGRQVSSGVYFYRISANKKVLAKKMILLR